MIVWKEVVRPGVVWYTDAQTGEPRKKVFTAEGVRYLFDRGREMLAAKLSVPVPLEHQSDAYPLTPSEKAAKQLLNNAGWVQQYQMRGDTLYAAVDVQDEDLARKLPHTIKWTSPYIDSFVDGDGRPWEGVISHLALTSRPRLKEQEPFEPFPTIAAAMTALAGAPDELFDPNSVPRGGGFCLSRAGLLERKGDSYRPAYPMAFSHWAGVSLAEGGPPGGPPNPNKPPERKPGGPPGKDDGPPDKSKGPPGKDGPPGKGDSDSDSPKGPGKDRPAAPPTPAADGGGFPPAGPEALVDADGDISVISVCCDLLDLLGVSLPGGTTKDNFYERLYQAMMGRAKGGFNKGPAAAPPPPPPPPETKPMTNQPPGKGLGNDLAPNPKTPQIEPPPLYMSLEEINRIPDPHIREALRVSLSLRETSMAEAMARREQRIEALCRKVKSQAFRDSLVAKHKDPSTALGLSMTGVRDPMADYLTLLEQSTKEVPSLLGARSSSLVEMPHPEPPPADGVMTEERRQAVVNEIAKNSHLDERPQAPASSR